jgi:ketol-acid reductoisomerase
MTDNPREGPAAGTNELAGRTVAVIGYGSQGQAQAQNLHDSGIRVVVGVRQGGPSWVLAQKDGLKVAPVAQAVAQADIVMMLIPDEVQPEVFEREVRPSLRVGATLDFAHGFNIRFGTIAPPADADVILVAPKGPGAAVRDAFQRGSGVPALVAVHQDATGRALGTAIAIARAIGASRTGVIETTFAEEAETDLFGEQVTLCGGVTGLIATSFDVLVRAGYQPEVAYFEVLHELKMIVDLVQRGGIEHMWSEVSNTAEYGGRTRSGAVVDDHVRQTMERILADIRSGKFAEEWVREYQSRLPRLTGLREQASQSTIEQVGQRLRGAFNGGGLS